MHCFLKCHEFSVKNLIFAGAQTWQYYLAQQFYSASEIRRDYHSLRFAILTAHVAAL